ncbi:MAG: hypothetical protein IK147_05195 [Clostridia bacterium]|nr:hypothetical protein [Clostridia bacterium]
MTLTLIIACATFVALTLSVIFFPEIKFFGIKIGTYVIIALTGAILILIFCADIGTVFSALTENSSVNPLKILALFFSMTFLSVFLDAAGFFRRLAALAVRRVKSSQTRLFCTLYFLIAALTLFTSNDIVILTITPFICYFCKNAKVNPVPYLAAEFAAANTWSMGLIIGNPTNVYLGSVAGVTFTEYLKVMALPTLAAGATEFLIIFLLFRKSLKPPLTAEDTFVPRENRAETAAGITVFSVCLIFLVLSGYLDIEMWAVSSCSAACLFISALVISAVKKDGARQIKVSLAALPWQIIPFVLSMFVIVSGLEYNGVSDKISEFLGENAPVLVYGASSFAAANVINNIPMSILYGNLISHLSGAAYFKAVYASVIGSNIGAFLTPIGALAGIMFTGLNKKHGVDYGFKEFIKYGVIISIPTLFAALGVLCLTV